MRRRGVLRVAGFVLLVVALIGVNLVPGTLRQAHASGSSGISYVHDDLGRLEAVVDPVNGTAIYGYDAVGNITSISRQSPTAVLIIDFSPKRGPSGTPVTISGTGFSSTASQDAVAFGGTAATVTSASPTQLVATVPSGAASGAITVTAPGGTATSAGPFTVAGSPAPTIAGFTPTIGAPGSAVSITGANFETVSTNDIVAFNGARAQVTSATSISMSSVVPQTGSGRITVITPSGRATSSADFFVPPTGYTTADLGFTDRMAIGDSKSVTIGTPGKIALVVFDGTAGQVVNVGVSNITMGSTLCCTVSVLNPNGATLGSPQYISLPGGSDDELPLPTTGTYTMLLVPNGTATGSVTLSLSTDVTATGSVGGSPVTVTTTAVGQNARVTFSGASGQVINVGASQVSMGSGFFYLSVLNPDGTRLGNSVIIVNTGGSDDELTLPTTGTYTALVDPSGTATGSATISLSTDVTATGSVGGSPVTVTTTAVGQNARVMFSGIAGRVINVGASQVSMGSGFFYLSVLNPDGTRLGNSVIIANTGGSDDELTLPTTGTYTTLVDPSGTATGSATISLSRDVTATASVGGPAVRITTSAVGQNAKVTFSGSASQRVTMTMSNVTIGTSACCSTRVSILNPDSSTLVAPTYVGTSGGTITATTATTGTYTIFVDPQGTDTGGITLALTQALSAPAAESAPSPGPTRPAGEYPPRQRSPSSSLKRRPTPDRSGTGVPLALRQFRSPLPARWIPTPRGAREGWVTGWPASPWQSAPALQAQLAVTAVSGLVLALDGEPLPGVTLTLADQSATTDATGRFLLANLPSGHQVLQIDGTTANTDGASYGYFEDGIEVAKGETTVLPDPVWMTQLDVHHERRIEPDASQDQVITTPEIPGLQVVIPAHSVVKDEDGHVIRRLGITPIPVDRPPFPLPSFVQVPVYFTVQPGGTYVWPHGARIIYPNFAHQPPGARIEFWNYDPDKRGWHIYGHGAVSDDGTQVVPDTGVSVYEFTGAMINDGDTPPDKGPHCSFLESLVGCQDADPVDTGSGLFVYRTTDLSLPGPLPIDLTRVYRQGDTDARTFGVGTNFTYGMFLWSAQQYQQADLITPDGGRVHYVRISPGTGYTDAVFESTSTPGPFFKSQIDWNGAGWNLTTKDGMVLVFGMNAPLQSVRDRYGNQITVTRSPATYGDITQVSSSDGRWIHFTYNATHEITQAQDNAGRTVTYVYDSNQRLIQVTDAGGNPWTYGWGACPSSTTCNELLTITDPRQVVVLTNAYDSAGRVGTQTLADTTSAYNFAYTTDANGAITQTDVTDPRGNVHRLTFNTDGFTTSQTLAAGTPEQEAIAYERQAGTGLLMSVTDALGRRTAYGYDDRGNVTSITHLAGTPQAVAATFTYTSAFSQVASVTDPVQHTTTYGHDATGSLTSVTDPLQHTWTITPNGAGQVASVTDPLGHTTTYGYDLGDLTSAVDPLGRTRGQFVDTAGRVISVTDPMGQSTRWDYDALDQLTKVTDALGGTTTFTYDGAGHLLTSTDGRGNTTTYRYDDPQGRLTGRVDPLGHAETYIYDPDGNITSYTDRRGTVTTYRYDPLNRRNFVGFGTRGSPPTYSSTVDYTYDSGNRLTAAVDSVAGTITRGYDDLDRVTSETTPQGSVTYTYYDNGTRHTMTVAGQPQVSYSFDAADNVTGITQGTASVGIAYDAAGRPTSVTLPNGVVESSSYDSASEVTGITYTKGATTLGDLSYTYDPDGERTGVGGSWSRTGLPAAVASATYDADNRLTAWGGAALAYDADGNLTSDGTSTYTWSPRGLLASMSGGTSATFTYDAFGRRVKKTVAGTTTQVLYDGWTPVQELLGNGTPTANLLTGLGTDQLFTRTDSAGTRDFLTDAVGSVVALTDSAGTVRTTYTYDPYGATTAGGASSSSPYKFTARDTDATSLYYLRARYYSPKFGRFLSQDPMGYPGGPDPDLYRYAFDDPPDLSDPFGLDPTCHGFFGCVADFLHDHWKEIVVVGLDVVALGFTAVAFGVYEAALPFVFEEGFALGAAGVPFAIGAAGSAVGLGFTYATGGSWSDVRVSGLTNFVGIWGPGWGIAADVAQLYYDWTHSFGEHRSDGKACFRVECGLGW